MGSSRLNTLRKAWPFVFNLAVVLSRIHAVSPLSYVLLLSTGALNALALLVLAQKVETPLRITILRSSWSAWGWRWLPEAYEVQLSALEPCVNKEYLIQVNIQELNTIVDSVEWMLFRSARKVQLLKTLVIDLSIWLICNEAFVILLQECVSSIKDELGAVRTILDIYLEVFKRMTYSWMETFNQLVSERTVL